MMNASLKAAQAEKKFTENVLKAQRKMLNNTVKTHKLVKKTNKTRQKIEHAQQNRENVGKWFFKRRGFWRKAKAVGKVAALGGMIATPYPTRYVIAPVVNTARAVPAYLPTTYGRKRQIVRTLETASPNSGKYQRAAQRANASLPEAWNLVNDRLHYLKPYLTPIPGPFANERPMQVADPNIIDQQLQIRQNKLGWPWSSINVEGEIAARQAHGLRKRGAVIASSKFHQRYWQSPRNGTGTGTGNATATRNAEKDMTLHLNVLNHISKPSWRPYRSKQNPGELWQEIENTDKKYEKAYGNSKSLQSIAEKARSIYAKFEMAKSKERKTEFAFQLDKLKADVRKTFDRILEKNKNAQYGTNFYKIRDNVIGYVQRIRDMAKAQLKSMKNVR